MTETQVAQPVVAWLLEHGWDVHQEVCQGRRADIVAVQGPLVWILEVKQRFGMEVLNQAYHWIGGAHFVSVATRPARIGPFITAAVERVGIGVMFVDDLAVLEGRGVRVVMEPRLHRRAYTLGMLDFLSDATRTWAKAGSTSAAGYWTPFAQTCRNVQTLLSETQGLTTREVFDRVKHHYRQGSTARSCMLKWAQLGKIRGVEIRLDERGRARWYFTAAVGQPTAAGAPAPSRTDCSG